MEYFPPVGFHFKVDFLDRKIGSSDAKFQEVSGLSVTLETENYVEGGENRFTHKVPTRTTYTPLELKRGLVLDSGLSDWVRKQLTSLEIRPIDLLVSLLDENGKVLSTWNVKNAYPIEWTVSAFNAEESKIVVESIKLNYQYFDLMK